MIEKKNIAIVVQRWHPSIAGGAESLAYHHARLLSEKYDVDLLTTTALKSTTWENELTPGKEEVDGVRIIRFNVSIGRSAYWEKLHDLLLRQTQTKIPWSLALQEEWIRFQGPHSEDLINYIRTKQNKYAAIIFVTYLYSTSYFGMLQTDPERIIFVPTLHDEPPAHLSVFKHIAHRAGRILWISEGEKELGKQIWGYDQGKVVSMSIATQIHERKTEPTAISNVDPFILYSGRIDRGKGCDLLLKYFLRYKKENQSQLQLVFTGSLNMKLPRNSAIIYKGFVEEEEKLQLMNRAMVFVMPSVHESLSVVSLEAMAQKTAVLVNGENRVLLDHIERSGGGKTYVDYKSFAVALAELEKDRQHREELGEKGRKYVLKNYDVKHIQEQLLEEVGETAGMNLA